MKKRQKKQRAILIALVVILGLGFLSFTGHYLNERYDWVGQTQEFFNRVSEDQENDTTSETTSELELNARINARNVEIKQSSNQDGSKTLVLVTTPAHAEVDLSWSSDNDAVVFDKTGEKTVNISVLNHFAPYATITVEDDFSGLSTSSKIYSYAKTTFGTPGSAYNEDMLDNKGVNGKIIFTEENSTELPTNQYWTNVSNSEIAQGKNAYDTGYANSAPKVDWFKSNEYLYMHVLFNGSYSPLIHVYNEVSSTDVFYNLDDLTSYDYNGIHGHRLTIKIYLEDGLNWIGLFTRNHKIEPSILETINPMSEGVDCLTSFYVRRGVEATGMTVPDLVFYD